MALNNRRTAVKKGRKINVVVRYRWLTLTGSLLLSQSSHYDNADRNKQL